MGERPLTENGYDLELMTVSQDFCQRIIKTGHEIVREQNVSDDELADILTCGSLHFHHNHNVNIIANGGVHARAVDTDERKLIPVGYFYLAYGECPQSPGINRDQASDFILRYVQDLGFINQPDLHIVRPNLKETSRAKRIRLKHPSQPVEISIRLSGDLKAEGFQLFFVTDRGLLFLRAIRRGL